jgi:hypothetical protein
LWLSECLDCFAEFAPGSEVIRGLKAMSCVHICRGRLPAQCNPSVIRLAALVALLKFSSTVSASGPMAATTMLIDLPAPGETLEQYLASTGKGDRWSKPNAVLMETDASFPGLAERGHLRAIRDRAEHQTPGYQVIHIEGDAMVKQQLIARYLTAEKRAAAMPTSSLVVTPANYKFRYVGSSGGPPIYAFHTTPRKKLNVHTESQNHT